MTRPDHPLTARVFVNRIWMHHFGRGIVASPNDFGFRGDAPSHPELLDWLATQFIQGGWNIKNLHRLMVNSTAYRQVSTRPTPDNDPENILLGRMNRRRLEGEAIRDAMLATAGVLNRQVGGPMVRVPLEPEVYDLIFTEGEPDGLWPITPDAAQHDRRSIYLFAKRNVRLPLLEVFDLPDRISSCAQRGVSTFAPQALVLMNGPIAQEQSRRFAQSLLREEAQSRPRWIEAAYQRCYNRPPRPVEIEAGLAFFDQQVATIRERQKLGQPIGVPPTLPEQTDPAEAAALIDYLLALMNANEFIYIR